MYENPIRIVRDKGQQASTFVSGCSFYDCASKSWGGSVFIGTNGGGIVMVNACAERSRAGEQGLFCNLNANSEIGELVSIQMSTVVLCSGYDSEYQVDSPFCITYGNGNISHYNTSNNKAVYGTGLTYLWARYDFQYTFSYICCANNTQTDKSGIFVHEYETDNNKMVYSWMNIVQNRIIDPRTSENLHNNVIFGYFEQGTPKPCHVSDCIIVDNDADYIVYYNVQGSYNFVNCNFDTQQYHGVTATFTNVSNEFNQDLETSFFYTTNCVYIPPTPYNTPMITPFATPSSTLSSTPSNTPYSTPSSTPSTTPSSTTSITPSNTPSSTPSSTPSTTPFSTPLITPSNTHENESIPIVPLLPTATPEKGQQECGKINVNDDLITINSDAWIVALIISLLIILVLIAIFVAIILCTPGVIPVCESNDSCDEESDVCDEEPDVFKSEKLLISSAPEDLIREDLFELFEEYDDSGTSVSITDEDIDIAY